MKTYNFPGFDRLEKDSPVKYAIPLCNILRSFIGESDFSYISAAFYPLEMLELILHYLKYDKELDSDVIDNFSQKYLIEDSLCPIDTLIELWGVEKFNQMIAELQMLAGNEK